MPSLRTTERPSLRALAEKVGDLRRPAKDAAAIGAQMARRKLDQAEGAALAFGKAARRSTGTVAGATAARARQAPVLTGALLLAVVAGGVLLLSGRARAAARAGATTLGAAALRAGQRERKPARPGRDPRVLEHQEDLLDEGIEESFPASDPVSVKRIT